MGYRPDDQSIEEPLRKILDGIKQYDSAVQKRMESRDWQESHLEEIDALNQSLLALRREMIRLMNDNW